MKTFKELREGSVRVGDKTKYQGSPARITHVDKKRQAVKAEVVSGKYKGQIVSLGFDELDEAVGDTALAFQTPQGTVTATKRNTKGMRGKQDGWSLSLKTKNGKVVDLGSHPNPTKANVTSIAKNATS